MEMMMMMTTGPGVYLGGLRLPPFDTESDYFVKILLQV